MYDNMQESTPKLIKCLISSLQDKEENRQIKKRCKESRNISKKLKSIAFEIILFGSHSDSDKNIGISGLSPIDKILAAVFNLRWEAKYNEANQLEACVFKLKQSNNLNDATTKNILSFLLLLSNEGDATEEPIGHILPRWQTPFPISYEPLIPDGPLSYSCATSLQNNRNTLFYTHYPREIFEKPGPDLRKCKSCLIDTKIFELPPGTNKFVHFPSNDKISHYLQQLSQTVYGALTHKISDLSEMDMKLEIPELGDISPAISLSSRIYGKASTKSQMSDDEGFTEPETPVMGYSNKSNKNIWEVVWSMEPRTFYTWEDLGSHEIHRQKPYLTESGENSVNAVENLWQNELKLLHPLLNFPLWKKRNNNEILLDISYVMLGVSSTTFWFCEREEKFIPYDNNILIGWTHQSLLHLLSDFALTGKYYYRLRKFSTEPTIGFTQGLIFRSFIQGLRRVLRYYHALVLTLRPRENILQFTMSTRKIRLQLQNLAELCWCGDTNFSTATHTFPSGMRLLSYLYVKCSEAVASDFYLVLLSLLMTSSAPYLKFLHSWIYNGICNDPFDEFPIKQNGAYLCYRDNRYWSKAFKMSAFNYQMNWPLVSYELLEEVFVSGKGVNLLKMCAPLHPLCTSQTIEAPELKLTFSKSELESIHWKSEHYSTSMESIRKEKRLSWRQFQEQEKLKEKINHEAVVKGAANTLEKIEKQIADIREAKILEKKKQMAELQGQIKEVEERRKKEKELELEQEKKDMEEKEKQFHSSEHYQLLKAKSELREKRAEWRARRTNMNNARLEFLERDKMQVTIGMASLNVPKDDNMQTSPDQVVTSESMESLDASSLVDSSTISMLSSKEMEKINKDNLTQTLNKLGQNVNDVNSDVNANNSDDKLAGKVMKRPEILDLELSGRRIPKCIATKKTKHKPAQQSDSSGVADLIDGASENSSESGARDKTGDGNGRELVLRLISEESSGKDSGMYLQTPDEGGEEKIDTPMSTLSTTQSSDSVISSFMSNEDEYFPPGLALINAGVIVKSRGRSEHGHASESTLQSLMYPQKRPGVPELKGQLINAKNLTSVRAKKKNVYGHVSDSTIQTMIYGDKSISAPATPMDMKRVESSKTCPTTMKRSISVVTPYSQDFTFEGKYALADMMSPIHHELKNEDEDDGVHELLPLDILVQRSLMNSLTSQILLVKSSVYDYFLVELKLLEHLQMLRSFLLLHDGDFAQSLSDQIFDKMALGVCPAELLNPLSLNSVLSKAMNASLLKDDPMVKNFSFALPVIPNVFPLYTAAPFEGLELQYKLMWPINIVITTSTMTKYNKLFRFLMQIRHAQWALNDVFYHLKRNVRVQYSSSQFTQLQLFRHEMQHFVRVLHAYITNQVLQVSWAELKCDVTCDVQTLDHLNDIHVKYLNRALFRCLLHKKAAPVMRIVQMIFVIILKFNAQMVSLPWLPHPQTGIVEHQNFGKLFASYRIFREYSGFLYKAWLHDAVGTPSNDEISYARVPAALERILIDAQLQ